MILYTVLLTYFNKFAIKNISVNLISIKTIINPIYQKIMNKYIEYLYYIIANEKVI